MGRREREGRVGRREGVREGRAGRREGGREGRAWEGGEKRARRKGSK